VAARAEPAQKNWTRDGCDGDDFSDQLVNTLWMEKRFSGVDEGDGKWEWGVPVDFHLTERFFLCQIRSFIIEKHHSP
jgi:hypothetical protein